MKIKWCILPVLLIMGTSLQAQLFREGKLMTIHGDTLEGLVARQGPKNFVYKKHKKAGRNIFKTTEITAYIYDDTLYEKHEIEVIRSNFPERTKNFLKVVVLGPVRLMEYRNDGIYGNTYVNHYVCGPGAAPMRVNSGKGNFKSQMAKYFRDDEELSRQIKQKELGYDNLVEIVKRYNDFYVKSLEGVPEIEENDPPEEEEKEKKEKKRKKNKEEGAMEN